MTVSASPSDLELALALAARADEVTMAGWRRPDLRIDTKPDMTPVSEADQAAEAAIRSMLADARPNDAVVGEEYGSSGSGNRRWILDPIDGTKSYVRGLPAWATLISLEEDGEQIVGVASAPGLGRRWWAGRGLGAFAGPCAPGADGDPIAVSAIADLADAQLSGSTLDHWDDHAGADRVVELATRCYRDRGYGDFWSHVLVAEGCVEIGLDPVASLWDLAAVAIIVEEAGGRFTDLSGRATADGGSGISTNGLLHDEVLTILTAPR